MSLEEKLNALALLEYKCFGHQMFGIFNGVFYPDPTHKWFAYWRNCDQGSGYQNEKESTMKKVQEQYFTNFEDCVNNAYDELKQYIDDKV